MGWDIYEDEDDIIVEKNGQQYTLSMDDLESLNEGDLNEKWSQKYKSSINCSHPKGFSQKAHCAGKRKHNEDITMEMTCPDCGMCETHGDHSRDTIDENCWKGYHKEGNKKLFGKTVPNCVKNESKQGVAEGLLYSGDTWQDVLYRINVLNDIFGDQKDLAASFEPASQPEWGPFRDRILRSRTVLDTYAKVKQLANMNVPLTDAEVEMLDDVAWDGGGGPVEPAGHWGERDYDWLFDLYAKQYAVVEHLLDQRAQGQGQNKNKSDQTVHEQGVAEGHESCPECGGAMYPDTMINEKQDACYYKVMSRYKVWPSAYASGALVQCRKKGAANWGNKSKNESKENTMDELSRIVELSTGLSLEARAELAEEFDLIETIIEDIAEHNGVDAEVIWEDLESLTDDELYVFATTTTIMETEAWQKANKRDKTDGMSRKAVKTYRREHPGSKLQTAVTTKPSKLKKGSKASKRRKSYCSRSRGQMKMHNISCAKTPDKAICKARRRWNC